MADYEETSRLLKTNQPDLFFEDNTVGRCKKEVWDASDEEIETILAEYGIPSPCEWGTPGAYIQTTVRHQVEANRRKNDIVFIPIGCTELHGRHLPSASDTLYVSQILEGSTADTSPAPPTPCTSARSWRACGATPRSEGRRSTWPCPRSTTGRIRTITWACRAR
jgi:hypothetical protein